MLIRCPYPATPRSHLHNHELSQNLHALRTYYYKLHVRDLFCFFVLFLRKVLVQTSHRKSNKHAREAAFASVPFQIKRAHFGSQLTAFKTSRKTADLLSQPNTKGRHFTGL